MVRLFFRCAALVSLWMLVVPVARAGEPGDYLPENVDVVVSVNFAKLVDSPLAKQYLPELVKGYGLDAFRELAAETEVRKRAFKDNEENIRKILADPAETRRWFEVYGKSVQRVTVAGRGNSSGDPEIMLFEGNWDAKLLDGLLTVTSLATPEDLKVVKDGKRKYFQILPKEGSTPVGAVLSDQLAVMAPTKEGLYRALDVHEGKKVQNKANQVLRDMVRKFDPDAVASFCIYRAENKSAISVNVFVDKEIRLEAKGIALDEDGAKELVDEIKGAVRTLRNEANQAAKLNASFKGVVEAIDKVKIDRTENEIRIEGRLPADVIQKLMKQLLKDE